MAMPPDSAVDAEALLAAEIQELGSDVIGLQEVDYFLGRSNNHNQTGNVATAMKASDWAFAPSLMGSPDDDWRNPNSEDAKIVTNMDPEASPGYGIGMVSTIPVTSWHRLDLTGSPVGVFMAFPVDGKMKKFYVRDHPRSALAAHLENGWLIINTHLSFVPGFNLLQLIKIKRWANKLGVKDKSKILIMGDMNIPFRKIATGFTWNSLVTGKTFPSWQPKVQIDYFLSQSLSSADIQSTIHAHAGMSDHLAVQIEVATPK
jgi:endonuclease/exonuclease/phosphatase family metal-dependent hydrolase